MVISRRTVSEGGTAFARGTGATTWRDRLLGAAICGMTTGAVGAGPRRTAHTRRTALLSSQPLGSVEVVHPFHPLRGKRFVVLKIRRVAGVETLSLRDPALG